MPGRAPVARARDPAREAARDAAREAAFERADALAAEKRATARRARDAFRRGTALDASGDHAGASRWLDRAHRLARADHTIGFALALARLRAGDAAGAVAPLLAIHRALGLRQAAVALAIARWRQGLTAAAAHLLAGTLSGQLFDTGDPSLPAVADAIARDAGFDGWCAIGDDWVLRVRVSGESGARAARDPDMRVPRDTEGRAPRAFELRRPRDFEVRASRDFEVRTSRDFEVRAWRDFEVRASRDGTPVGGGVAAIGRPFELGLGADGVLRADRLLVEAPEGVRLLAPSIDLAAIASLEGLVETDGAGGLQGWAWRPNAPAHAPVLTLARAADGRVLATVGTDAAIEPVIEGRTFGMVPRGFRVAAAHCPPGGLVLRDERGRPLGGSPVEAGIEVRAMAARADPDAPGAAADARRFAPVDARHVGDPARPRAAPGRRRVARAAPVAIVVPVYRGLRETRACLEAVFATVPAGTAVHVVDDGSPDAALVALIEREAEAGRIALHRHPDRANLGFPASANLGIARAAPEADVVLLNADAIPAGDWLARLRAAASAPGVASATPLSNEGSILSYPRACRPNPMPDAPARARLASWAAAANPGETVEIPVGVGFCLLLRRAAIDAVGVFRTDLFGRGYGEENDWCLRARHRGFRHVACLDAYVAHAGGASFGAGREALLRRNGAILERLHPGYDAMIAAFIAADPLAPYRRRLDRVRVLDEAASAGGEAVLFVTHAAGGGVERFVRARIADARRAGRRPVVLRGDPEGMRDDLCIVETGDAAGGDAAGAPANLRYALPDEAPALAALLASLGPVAVELHHLLGHDAAVPDLLRSLGAPLDVWIHDYASFCHRIALFGPARHYCGEPDLAGCRACVAELGSLVDPAGDAWRGGDAGGARRGAERTDGATGAEPADGAGHAGRAGDTDDPRRANGAGDLGRGNGAGDPERAKGADDTGRVGASADVWRGGGAGGAERADGAGDAERTAGASDAGRAAVRATWDARPEPAIRGASMEWATRGA